MKKIQFARWASILCSFSSLSLLFGMAACTGNLDIQCGDSSTPCEEVSMPDLYLETDSPAPDSTNIVIDDTLIF